MCLVQFSEYMELPNEEDILKSLQFFIRNYSKWGLSFLFDFCRPTHSYLTIDESTLQLFMFEIKQSPDWDFLRHLCSLPILVSSNEEDK